MRDIKVIEEEIESLRKEMNSEITSQFPSHIPSEKMLELSKKMDVLLDEYRLEYYTF